LAAAKVVWRQEDSTELRKAVHAVLVEGLSQQEAADTYGVRANTVSRAVKRFHVALEKIGSGQKFVLWSGFVPEDTVPVLDHFEGKCLEPLEKELEKSLAKKAQRKTPKK
jgi:hypothetical protein